MTKDLVGLSKVSMILAIANNTGYSLEKIVDFVICYFKDPVFEVMYKTQFIEEFKKPESGLIYNIAFTNWWEVAKYIRMVRIGTIADIWPSIRNPHFYMETCLQKKYWLSEKAVGKIMEAADSLEIVDLANFLQEEVLLAVKSLLDERERINNGELTTDISSILRDDSKFLEWLRLMESYGKTSITLKAWKDS